MKIRTTRDQILPSLMQLGGVVERKSTLPILANVLVKVDKQGSMFLTATDLEVELKTKISAESDADGEFTVGGRKLLDICKALPEGAEIQISIENEKAIIRSGRGRYSLGILPAVDYPPSIGAGEPNSRFRVKEAALKKALDMTSFAMAQQDVRYYLNGLLLEVTAEELRAVSTDGHRLALAEVKFDQPQDCAQQLIVPRKAVLELSRLLSYEDKEVEIAISGSFMQVKQGDRVFTSKLIDGKYPDYRRVIPSNSAYELAVGIDELRKVLQRTSILANEKFRGVHFRIEKGSLSVQAHNPEQEEAEESLDVQYEGPEINIGFNVSYVLDVLSVLTGELVTMSLLDGNSSCVLKSVDQPGCIYVVMPMRI